MNSILQCENYSCGPVSILNIFKYFNIKHSLDENDLIKLTWAKPLIGSKNEDLEKVLQNFKNLNFNFSKKNSNIQEIKKEIKFWNVLLINYYNPFSQVWHYAIIVWYDEKTQSLFFRDSSLGDLRLSYENFDRLWHNWNKTILKYMISISKKICTN